MKKFGMFRNVVTCLAAVGILNTVSAEDAKSQASTVEWKQIGEAPGVVGMAVSGGKLFSVTSGRKLQVGDASAEKIEWQTVGQAPGGVVAMGASDGKLYVSLNAASAGRFQKREAVTNNAPWEDDGHAWCLVGMAGMAGKMYAVIDTKELGSEPTIMSRELVASSNSVISNARGLDGLPWGGGIDRRPPVGSLAMSEVDGKFYVATKEDALFVGNPTKPEVKWEQIGDAAGVTILAGGQGKLFAATKSGKLLVWTPKN